MPDSPTSERASERLAPGVVLRAAVREDVPELLRLVRALASYEKEPDAVEASESDYQRILFPEIGSPTGHAEVAEVDGRVVGMAFWYVTFSTWSGRNGIWLEDFYVEEHMRGRGLGHALLGRLARLCVIRGYARLEWWVLDWNQSAIDFYETRGARGLGEWTHYRVDGAALAELGST
jgi:GNAT superfamily N-acetyltransferase